MKKILIGIMLAYISVMVMLIIFNTERATQKFGFEKNESYLNNLDSLKTSIINLKVSDICRSTLNDYIKISENTYLEGTIELSKFYNVYSNNIIFNNYEVMIKNCNIEGDSKEELRALYLASAVYPDIMMSKLTFIYEIRIIDYMNDNDSTLLNNTKYQTIKNNEIITLKHIVNYLESKEA